MFIHVHTGPLGGPFNVILCPCGGCVRPCLNIVFGAIFLVYAFSWHLTNSFWRVCFSNARIVHGHLSIDVGHRQALRKCVVVKKKKLHVSCSYSELVLVACCLNVGIAFQFFLVLVVNL